MSTGHIETASAKAGFAGNGTAATGTATAPIAAQAIKYGITIYAHDNNTGVIYVGFDDQVDANFVPLAAGKSIFLPIDDAAKVFLLGSAAAQDFGWIGI